MTQALQHLIGQATATANPGPAWIMEGGRSCPVTPGVGMCSQPVFRVAGTDHYDYGEPGGLGWNWCRHNCEHGHREHFARGVPEGGKRG